MKLGGVQRARRRTFVQLPLNFLCELCVFVRDNALTSSPDDSAWEDVVFVSRQDAKLAKESQRRKDVRSSSLASSQRPITRSYSERLSGGRGNRTERKAPQAGVSLFA